MAQGNLPNRNSSQPRLISIMKLSDMTPEAKRIAIAEACGWVKTEQTTFSGNPMWQKDGVLAAIRHALIDGAEWLPDYLGSLDACHEMEKTLNPGQWSDYTMTLRRIVQAECDKPECYVPGCERAQLIADFWFYHATAAQRSDAFLIAKGLATL